MRKSHREEYKRQLQEVGNRFFFFLNKQISPKSRQNIYIATLFQLETLLNILF